MSEKLIQPYIYYYFDKIRDNIIYVGKTNGRNRHYKTGSKILKRYISIYGFENFDNRFDRNIIEHCSINDLNNREEYFIKLYQTQSKGVNITKGGEYDWNRTNSKPVLQYDLKGNFIREWSFMKQPIIENIGTDYNGISACCLGKQLTSNGFVWRFKKNSFIPKNIKLGERKQYKKRIGGGGAIKITIQGQQYSSKEECMRVLKIPPSKLNKLLKDESKS
jgi:hypothetical protein